VSREDGERVAYARLLGALAATLGIPRAQA
jgi:hypothetical protein